MDMTAELEKPLEKSFVDDIATFVGPCICDKESCKNFIYKFLGRESDLEYVLEYDAETQDSKSVNIQVYIKESKYVVFSGRCDNNHDLAQALRMTVI